MNSKRYVLFVVTVYLNCTMECHSTRISGLYVDNGLDQMVKHESISFNDIETIKYELSNALGLPVHSSATGFSLQSNRGAASMHLMDIYKQFHSAETNQLNKRSRRSAEESEHLLLTDDMRRIIVEESDNIITITAKDGRRFGNDSTYCFEIDEKARNSMVSLGILHIYKSHADVSADSVHKISIFEVTSPLNELTEMASRDVAGDYVGWVELNITKSLFEWTYTTRKQHFLYIRIDAQQKISDWLSENHEHRPFITAYLLGENVLRPLNENNKVRTQHRQRRSIRRNPLYGADRRNIQFSRACRMHLMYVSFRDLRMKWILAPEGYSAFYCKGDCNFPLNQHTNATNHAQIQMLAHVMHPHKIPKPCCVPIKTTALSVLHFINKTDVILRKYRSIVAKQCGCH